MNPYRPPRTVEITSQPPRSLTVIPDGIVRHFAGQGFLVDLASISDRAKMEMYRIGRSPILAEELPEDTVTGARRQGYRVEQDGTLAYGDCILYKQSRAQRDQMRAEARTLTEAFERGHDADALAEEIEALGRHGGKSHFRVDTSGVAPVSHHVRSGPELVKNLNERLREAAASR